MELWEGALLEETLMRFDKQDDGRGQLIDRRTLLQRSAVVTGGLTLGVGRVTANSKPVMFTRNFEGETRTVPCRDEKAEITRGIQHVRLHTTVDADGGFHLDGSAHWDRQIVAVGVESGIEWSGQGTKMLAHSVRGRFPQTTTLTDNTTLTSNGDTENIKLRNRFHVTINSNGDVTALRNEAILECF